MKLGYYLAALFLCLMSSARGDVPPEQAVAAAVERLRLGVLNADRAALENAAAEELVYGHSSGMVENKAQFVEAIAGQNVQDYLTADIAEQTIKFAGGVAIVRHIFSAQTMTSGTPGSVRIGVMQIWQNRGTEWKLIARQAHRFPSATP